uniref:Uncharacterized protein n=1 Tax=Glossina palpalis gambiensis TaxID=67801 RepID=A0A1B0BD51_9MUSC
MALIDQQQLMHLGSYYLNNTPMAYVIVMLDFLFSKFDRQDLLILRNRNEYTGNFSLSALNAALARQTEEVDIF